MGSKPEMKAFGLNSYIEVIELASMSTQFLYKWPLPALPATPCRLSSLDKGELVVEKTMEEKITCGP